MDKLYNSNEWGSINDYAFSRRVKITFLYLDSPNEDFVAVAETVLLTLKLASIKVQATLTWDTVYHHGYMENPFDVLVEETYIDTRSTYINIQCNAIELVDKISYIEKNGGILKI